MRCSPYVLLVLAAACQGTSPASGSQPDASHAGGDANAADASTPGDSGTSLVGIPAFAMALDCDHCAKLATWPNASFGLLRLWDSNAAWATLEPHRGMYDWTYLDPALDYVAANHLQVIYTFGHVPCWATTGTCGPASWSAAPPTDNQDYFDFVTALVAHCSANGNCVKDYIKHWEMWNEANDTAFWSGAIADLMPLVSGAAPIITGAVPGAVLTTPSSTKSGSVSRDAWMTSWLQAGGSQLADIMAYHVYLDGVTPEEQLSVITTMQTVAQDNGMAGKPAWDTEGGWISTAACPTTFTAEDCIGQLARWYLIQLSNGVSEFTWYDWDDINDLAPAGAAYGVLYDWLVGATFTSACSANAAGVWTCALARSSPAGYHGLVVWNPAGASTYSAPADYTSYRDLAGGTTAISGAVPIGVEPVLLE